MSDAISNYYKPIPLANCNRETLTLRLELYIL